MKDPTPQAPVTSSSAHKAPSPYANFDSMKLAEIAASSTAASESVMKIWKLHRLIAIIVLIVFAIDVAVRVFGTFR